MTRHDVQAVDFGGEFAGERGFGHVVCFGHFTSRTRVIGADFARDVVIL